MPLLLKNKKSKGNRYKKTKTVPVEKAAKKRSSFALKVHLPDFVKSFGKLRKFLAGVAVVAVLAGSLWVVGYSFIWLYDYAVTSDFFKTRHIDVTGNVRLTREMVLEYAGIKEGGNCLAVSISGVEQNLKRTPWVEEVSVKRLLPDRFVIRLKERMPSFWVHKDGVLYYANEVGELIAPVESKNFLSLPTLAIEPGAEAVRPWLTQILRDLQGGGIPVEVGNIAQVSVSTAKGIEIYLEDREMRLAIATDDWKGNIERLGVAIGDLARRHELKDVREVHAVNGSVWVVLNTPINGGV